MTLEASVVRCKDDLFPDLLASLARFSASIKARSPAVAQVLSDNLRLADALPAGRASRCRNDVQQLQVRAAARKLSMPSSEQPS